MQNPILRVALVTAAILAIPAVMTNISADWNWGFLDFAVMGALIFGAGMTYELVANKGRSLSYRAATAIAVFTSLILIWVNAAVGIIGDGPHNMLYAGVIATGLVGAVLSRLNPRGLANTMFAMAVAQILVPVIVLLFWDTSFSPGVAPVFALNAVFAGAFVAAGVMFMRIRSTCLNNILD